MKGKFILFEGADSVYGQFLKRAVEFLMSDEYKADVRTRHSVDIGEYMIEKNIVDMAVDSLSIVEDRYNRLTGKRTSRWKDKQKMIDEELALQEKEGLEFESYVRY